MPNYRRLFIGRTIFFTVVTFNRNPIFQNETARKIFRGALDTVIGRHPFAIDAWCLLPDHLHCIWTLPECDLNYSLRWKEIKRIFSREYQRVFGVIEVQNQSRLMRKEAEIWQRRFWEHTIRDDEDLAKHIEYIHSNPVKHGLVKNAEDWKWSSYQEYIQKGFYSPYQNLNMPE